MDNLWRFAIAFGALLVTPVLLTSLFVSPKASVFDRFPAAGVLSLLLNASALIAMHMTGIRIDGRNLALIHGALFAVGVSASVVAWLLHGPLPLVRREEFPAYAALALYAVAVFPFTYLTGMDTYKWQDLATAIRVEGCIPWFLAPISLLGFGPRAYPIAQPAMLASAQIVGGVGVDAGYYLVSIFSGFLGLAAFLKLAHGMFKDVRTAQISAFLFVFSPVFLRYNHWATGRGLLMAVLPFFVHQLTRVPRPAACVGALLSGLIVALSHKAGLVAAVVIPPAMLVSACLPTNRPLRALLGAATMAGAAVAAPSMAIPGAAGRAVGATWLALSRFGFLLPAAAIGFTAAPPGGRPGAGGRPWRALTLPAALLLLPSLHSEMYASLLAAPFVALYAAHGVQAAIAYRPRRRRALETSAVALTLALAAATIVHHSRTATSPALRAAAAFLERYDPLGPYEVRGPGRARPSIQAYVSGSPRFSVTADTPPRVSPPPLPKLSTDPRELVPEVIRWMRDTAALNNTQTDWYGANPRRYYVVIDGLGELPPDARQIYSEGNVRIHADPRNEEIPVLP